MGWAGRCQGAWGEGKFYVQIRAIAIQQTILDYRENGVGEQIAMQPAPYTP